VITFFLILAAVPPGALLFWLLMRDWFLEWGATDLEVLEPMAGDEQVPEATHQTTLAVTVATEPADIWPWLVQMGYRRGGLYSYDWLDRLFGYLDGPSANRILPEFQQLRVGDKIPIGRGPAFPVTLVEPPRALAMGGAADSFQWTWQFELHKVGRQRTRLISRNRAHLPQTLGSMILMWVLEPAAFVMTRKMLLGIKRRAESLAHSQGRNMAAAA
jgi:hypothetical protein